jgi:hypothetical protein
VHDAANILRRYFNQLPEPIIPLQYYDRFRNPLRGHQAEAVGHIEGQSQSVGGFDPDAAVRVYQQHIKELPSLNRQLLLYILDLLAVFAAKADINKMTTSNLAAIFQPGILSHPQHDMSPQDYRLSQDVLIFLIDNQDHFLIGMEGTAVDEGTVKHIESGPSTPQARTPTTPIRNKSGLGRSASAASSAGADSLRKFGVRRNVSTSSKHSRHSGAVPSPTATAFTSGSGVHRSNTLPSKRSPAIAAARFPKERGSDPPTPATVEETKTPLPAVTLEDPTPTAVSDDSAKKLEQPPAEAIAEPAPAPQSQTFPAEKLDVIRRENQVPPMHIDISRPAVSTPGLQVMPGAFIMTPAAEPVPESIVAPAPMVAAQALISPPAQQPQRSPKGTPKQEKSEFLEGAVDSGPAAELTPAVRTFTQILSKVAPSNDEKQSGRKPNKLQKKRVPSANPSAHSSTHSLTGAPTGFDAPISPMPQSVIPHSQPHSAKEAPHAYTNDTVSSRNSGVTLKPSMSPSASFRSHSTATEYSEAEVAEEQAREEKRKFWKTHKRSESKATPTASQTDLHGSVPGADKSMSSFGSSSGWGGGGRRSLQHDSHQGSDISVQYGVESKEQGEKKSRFDWFQKKRQEHKDRTDKKNRTKSPPGSTSDLMSPTGMSRPKDDLALRGRSMDVPRPAPSQDRPTASQDSSDVTPTGTSPHPLAKTDAQPTVSPEASATSTLPTALTEPVSVAQPVTAPAPATNNPQSAAVSAPSTAEPHTEAPSQSDYHAQ